MRNFYHTKTAPRPAILGLTASPITRNKEGSLEAIEGSLNAIAKTPKINRAELLKHVFQPELIRILYTAWSADSSPSSQALQNLSSLYFGLDIEQDPYVIKLRAESEGSYAPELEKVLQKGKTYCSEQMKSLHIKSTDILAELGPWATDYYIHAVADKFCSREEDLIPAISALDNTEKEYLEMLLLSIRVPSQALLPLEGDSHLSEKVQRLLHFLKNVDTKDFTGLIFVRTRATCAVLAHLLSSHVQTKDKFRVSTFVGMSVSSNKKLNIGELVDVRNQMDTLDHLRSGQKNLVITTSVLEEGIDVSACNVVICFEQPPNLVSFIQRRGRARKAKSKYVLMFPKNDHQKAVATYKDLEEKMKQMYMDEMRQLDELKLLEAAEEGHREFKIDSTGAKITLGDAVQHLYHFCATLPADPYVDRRPEFVFFEHEDGSTSAKVILPNTVDASVREAESQLSWSSEKFARRDAAFEAYINLYRAELVSEHLLPLRGYDETAAEAQKDVEKIVRLIDVRDPLAVWKLVAQAWQAGKSPEASDITITGQSVSHMLMVLPWHLSRPLDLDLYWDTVTKVGATITPSQDAINGYSISEASTTTDLLLRSVFGGRLETGRNDFVALFQFARSSGYSLDHLKGACRADHLLKDGALHRGIGIVRDLANNGLPHIFDGVETTRPQGLNDQLDGVMMSSEEKESVEKEAYLRVKKLPKRADFLHPIPSQNSRKMGSGFRYLLAKECEVDNLALEYSQFALFIPSITHVVEVNMLAEYLCNNILSALQFDDLSLVITAISASAAQEPTNYQRMEFLGDSILKYFTSLTLMATHLNWHEGVLSHQKDHIVSNASLARSALAVGLDEYILTKPFTGSKWRPDYISDLLTPDTPKTRQLSTKTLADVIESLIGAAYLDGGLSKALACLQIFLPNTPWQPIRSLNDTLFTTYTKPISLPAHFAPLEPLLGHTFTSPILFIEALTHPSHHGTSSSYQRLEFLGDSILDRIVTTTAFAHEPPIPTHTLHLIRTALVNANFLAFLCMNLSTAATKTEIVASSDAGGEFSAIETTTEVPLWSFMRHSSPAVRTAQRDCLARFTALRTPISEALRSGLKYPWSLLAALDAPKFFSDLIESLLGAIYIDSQGSMDACAAFLEPLGLRKYLDRVLQRDHDVVVQLLHPKEELGQCADVEKVRYEVFREEKKRGSDAARAQEEEGEEDEERGRLVCRIWVGEREIVVVKGGRSVFEIETRAAEIAVRMLKEEKMQE